MGDEWVKLNVGGVIYQTTRTTLMKDENSMIYRMFSQNGEFMAPSRMDENGCYLIDRWDCGAIRSATHDNFDLRNGRYFEPILNYLRTGQILYEPNLNVCAILEEATFFGIQEMIDKLQQITEFSGKNEDNAPLTRQDVVRALIQTSCKSELRFQVRPQQQFN